MNEPNPSAPPFVLKELPLPARLTLVDGQECEVFLPAVYPGSYLASDEALKLGRATEWKQEPDGPVLGVGARTYLVGDDAIDLREWREVLFGE